MANPHKTVSTLLRQHGHSVTQARLRVFDALLHQEPQSMHTLVTRVSGVDRASVYRTIALFEQTGIVQRLYHGWKYTLELTDVFADHHHHLTCTRCGTSVAVNEHEFEALLEQIAARYHFTPTTHQLEVQGTCAACGTTEQQAPEPN
jgi:Fur family transcriptional regulator, ferric uptake regulator